MALRIVLFVSAVCLAVFIFASIRRSKLRIEDSLFWIALAFLILLLSVFPQIAMFFSKTLGFMATVNFVFLFFIFILLLQCYRSSKRISQLDMKVKELAQQVAIDRLDHYERGKDSARSGADAE